MYVTLLFHQRLRPPPRSDCIHRCEYMMHHDLTLYLKEDADRDAVNVVWTNKGPVRTGPRFQPLSPASSC